MIHLIAAAAVAFATPSAETRIVGNVLGPEGPLYVDGNLYFVGWVSGTLSKWDGRKATVLNSAGGCGHNGLALTPQKTFLLACTDTKGAILELDMDGKELRRWTADDRGRAFDGGINDIVVSPKGAAYATVFGPYEGNPTAVAGRVLYRAPGSDHWVQVADDLNYANGVAISTDQKTLFVDETVGNCILKFNIAPDGSLNRRSNFALLNLLFRTGSKIGGSGPTASRLIAKATSMSRNGLAQKSSRSRRKASCSMSSTSRQERAPRTSRSGPERRICTFRS